MPRPLYEFWSDEIAGTPADKAADFLARWKPGKTLSYDTDREGTGYFQVFYEHEGTRYVSDRMWMDGPDEHEVFLAIVKETEAMAERGEVSTPYCSHWVKPDDGIPL